MRPPWLLFFLHRNANVPWHVGAVALSTRSDSMYFSPTLEFLKVRAPEKSQLCGYFFMNALNPCSALILVF